MTIDVVKLADKATDGDAPTDGTFISLTAEELAVFANLVLEEAASRVEAWTAGGNAAEAIRKMKV